MFEVCVPKLILIIVCLFFLFSPVKFDDCKGNNKLTFEVSNPDFKVERDGTLVALKNMSEAGRTLFVHAQSEHAEDLAEILIVEEKEKHGALKVRYTQKIRRKYQEMRYAVRYLHVLSRTVSGFNLLAGIKISLQSRYCCKVLVLNLI